MNLFASDLDNTLIYSYKRELGSDKVLVETKGEKALSYMTARSFFLLRQLRQQMAFVPITTRSVEQYRRIFWGDEPAPEYALVANGGVLFHKGRFDKDWFQESLELIRGAEPELEKGMELLRQDPNLSFEIRRVDGVFVFTKSKEIVKSKIRLEERLNSQLVSVFENGSKLYILPNVLNKGTGLKRLRKRLNAEFVACAGDSVFDVPMLAAADLALYPESLAEDVPLEGVHGKPIGGEELFSDGMLEYLTEQVF